MAEQRPTDLVARDDELRRLLVETVEDAAIFVIDSAGLVRDWGFGAERLVGYGADEVVGRSAELFMTPEDARGGRLGEEIRETQAKGRVERDGWLVRKGGGLVRVRQVTTPLRDEAGRVEGFARVVRDRSAAWRAEQAIEQTEPRFRTAFDGATIGMAVADPSMRILEANPAFVAIVGYSVDELRQMNVAALNHPDDNPQNAGLFQQLLDGAIANFVVEMRYRRKDGEVVWVKNSVALVRDDQREPLRFVALAEPINDLKAAEATIAAQVRLAEFGRDVTITLAAATSLRAMLERCARLTVDYLDGAFARIWTLDPSGAVLELQASAGMYTHTDGPHQFIPVGQFKIGTIAANRRPHLTNAVVGDPLIPEQDWAKAEGMVAFAGYPLVVEDRLVGVLAMFARHPLADMTLRAMAAVADGIAIGIERRLAEERFHREQEWLRVTLASIGDAIIATDTEGRVTFLNGVAESLTGWRQAEAAGRSIEAVFRIINETTREPAEHPVGEAIREGIIVGLANHTVLIARDGTETAIEDSAAPIRDAAGAIIGVVMVFRDATDERRHAAELRESEERFRQMAESIAQLAWMAEPDGRIFWYNQRWYDYTGTTFEQMAGWGWRSVHDLSLLAAVEERWRDAIARGEPFDMVFPLRGKDGVFRPFLTRILPIKDEAGRVVRWVGTNTDISDRLRIEDELRLAKEEAETANQAKDHFLAILSHELRTPLNPILLATSAMLETTPAPGEVRSTLRMIRQNVLLQSRLIDDLLDVMRIVRGKMPLHWEVVDGHRLLLQSQQICQSEVFGKELRLELDLQASDHHINADPARLQQVFWNLIKNAVKFTPGGGSITIRTSNLALDVGSQLLIEVTDTGIGIEAAVLPLVFDPFQQGEAVITRKFGGLGLGLAICKGIVESHGGSITVQSAGAGRGTTFRVTLAALPEATVEEGESGEVPRSTGAEPLAPVPSLRMLLVEDEPATLRLMARLLRSLGHNVTTAGTITAAFEAVELDEFDMIISDIGLPDGTGLDLIRRVTALRGPTPAIALTGYGMEEDIVRSRAAGFTTHMTKPIDFAKLEIMIRQVAPKPG